MADASSYQTLYEVCRSGDELEARRMIKAGADAHKQVRGSPNQQKKCTYSIPGAPDASPVFYQQPHALSCSVQALVYFRSTVLQNPGILPSSSFLSRSVMSL
jgi:hypothetical protein